jgi:predicted Zn-dependent protease
MLERVIEMLEGQPGVNDWLVRDVTSRSTQYYLAGERPENERAAEVQLFEVEVYNDHPAAQGGEPSRGSASLTLVPGEVPQAAERIREAVFMAGLTDNPPYGLPGPAVYPGVLTADRRLRAEPAHVAEELGQQIVAAVADEPGTSLASAEVFVDERTVALRNSRGIRAEQGGTSLLVDLVLLAKDPGTGREMEAHIEVRRRALETLDLPALVRQQAQYARDALRAGDPDTGPFPVLVSGDALRDLLGGAFMSPIAFRSCAQFKYQGLSPWEVGQSIFGDTEPTGDPLTVYANAILPWGVRSAAFDQEGLPGRRLLVVENGLLRCFWATQRYAEYLKVPPTGQFGNLEVLPGSMAVADMWRDDSPLYHIVAFSAMAPDPVTGNFVGEIRLGYERRGHEFYPVKGGSLSGNLFGDLARARLSQETVFLGNYQGPQAIFFPSLTVSGA